MTAEILRNLPVEVYHEVPSPFVSHSRLLDFVEHGPRFFHGRYITGEIAREEKEHFYEGQALEDLFQRGEDALFRTAAIKPAGLDGRTKDGKAWNAANANRWRIDSSKYEEMRAWCEVLRECEPGMEKIRDAEQQVTLRGWMHGCRVQARPDWLRFDDMRPVIVDLKTARDLNALVRDNGPAIWKFHYHSQLALMRRLLADAGYPNAVCYLFVVDKVKLRSALVKVPEGHLRAGERFLDEELPRLAECFRTDTWPRAIPEVVELETPGWMERRAESTVQP